MLKNQLTFLHDDMSFTVVKTWLGPKIKKLELWPAELLWKGLSRQKNEVWSSPRTLMFHSPSSSSFFKLFCILEKERKRIERQEMLHCTLNKKENQDIVFNILCLHVHFVTLFMPMEFLLNLSLISASNGAPRQSASRTSKFHMMNIPWNFLL